LRGNRNPQKRRHEFRSELDRSYASPRRDLRGLHFYNREVSASAALEQEDGEATLAKTWNLFWKLDRMVSFYLSHSQSSKFLTGGLACE
jgi:hypothetical protein